MLLYPKPEKRKKVKKRLKATGDKTDAWANTRAELVVRFEAAGVTSCELKWEGCWRNNALSFAHSKKRRYIASQEELEIVALLCQKCHHAVEYSPNMTVIIERVIASRRVKV